MTEQLLPVQYPGISTGNAIADGRLFNHWFVGDIRKWIEGREDVPSQASFGLRENQSIEVKWGIHRKGEERSSGWAPCLDLITLSILLRGKFLLRFRRPSDRDREWVHTLAVEGDYAIWDELIEHNWTAEDESVILTVRWREKK
jgi:hypothetical protein